MSNPSVHLVFIAVFSLPVFVRLTFCLFCRASGLIFCGFSEDPISPPNFRVTLRAFFRMSSFLTCGMVGCDRSTVSEAESRHQPTPLKGLLKSLLSTNSLRMWYYVDNYISIIAMLMLIRYYAKHFQACGMDMAYCFT